jgi:hypothetical protein
VTDRGLGNLVRRARAEDVEVNVVQDLQPPVVLTQRAIGANAMRHVSLNAEVARDAALPIVEAQVVPFDRHRGSIGAALVGLDVQPAAIEELAPDLAAVRNVVPEQIGRRRTQELFSSRAVLRQHRVVDLCDALMCEHVVERLLLVDRVVPSDRLVEHHEEESVQRLGKEELQAIVGFHGVLFRDGDGGNSA